jgi:outer membrane protein assembly factor BamB
MAFIAIGIMMVLPGQTRAAEPVDNLAGFIRQSAGLDAGMALVVNDPDGKLTAAMAKGNRLTVQGCAWDDKAIQSGRAMLQAAGVADRASIMAVEEEGLPYADGLMNLLVAASWGRPALDIAEVLRVLAPGGTALVGNDANPEALAGFEAKIKAAGVKECKLLSRNGWVQFVKPIDPGLGTWTHLSGSADLSYVNEDKVVAPWDEIRWIGDPRWGSLYSSYAGVVSAGGRIYYKENRTAFGGKQSFLIARDAYNGFELWRVPAGSVWKSTYIISDVSLACDDRRVYIVEDKVLVARDGLTGKKLREYTPGFLPATVTSMGGSLLVSDKTRAAAMDQESGKILWTRPSVAHPAAMDGVAFVLGATDLEAVDTANGASRWKTKSEAHAAKEVPHVFCKAGVIYISYTASYKPPSLLAAYDAKDGKLLWKKADPGANYGIFPFPGEIWLLAKTQTGADSVSAQVLDARTGNLKREVAAKGKVPSHCNPSKATANYLLYANSWYLDTRTGQAFDPKTVRTPCQLGHCPANGMTYFLPHHCNCGVTLRGVLAMAKGGNKKWLTDAAKEGSTRLFSSGAAPSGTTEQPDDWPMFRKDTRRSNATTAKLPEQLKPLWTEKLAGNPLTQATVAYGLVCTAEPKTHRVFARDAATGKERWTFIADGRVEFPPALHKGLCLFGTGGGSVYCLDAMTGKEIWRLRAAPAQKYLAEEGQFASTWPVIGGVMPLDGAIYFTCGRATTAEGLWMIAADASTGKVRWRKRGRLGGDLFMSDGKELVLTGTRYAISDGRVLSTLSTKGVLQASKYGTEVSLADYMTSVEPSMTYKKHNFLTDGWVGGENLAFNESMGVAAYRYVYHMPAVTNRKDKADQRFIYAAAAGKTRWMLDDNIAQQMIGVVLANETAYLAGVPTSQDPGEKSELWVLAGADGKKLQVLPLDARPVYDGLSAANGRLFLATEDGRLICYGTR